MLQMPSGAFYLRGTLADAVETELLIDTGSSYVVLSKATFEKLNQAEAVDYKRSINGATAVGRVIKARVYEVSELALGEDCVLRAVEVVVLPGSKRDILGLSALQRVQPFTFDIGPMALRFSACGAKSPVEEVAVAETNVAAPRKITARAAGASW